MIKKWSQYTINENLQKARSILRKNDKKESNEDFQKLRKLLSSNTGYLGKFTEWLIEDNISYERLEDLFKSIKSGRLSKSIDDFKTPEEVIDSLIRSNADSAINQIIGAIPSETRKLLKIGDECKECDGDREEGIGEIGCEECDSNGEIECRSCEGDGCIKCDGCGEIDCDKCEGSGLQECKLCKDVFTNGTKEWKSLLKFLTLHVDKKDSIISFLSKKSGRYSDDIYDYGYERTIDMIKYDIERLLNMKSIDEIFNEIDKDKDIKFIYNDDKVLIIAVNYSGIRKYGSSYWCITEDIDTYDNYVYDDECINQQWIAYFKDKKPLVDNHSVMGITYDISNKKVKAAHWEDDSDAVNEAKRLLYKLKIDDKDVLNALEIFDHADDDLVLLWQCFPHLAKEELKKIFKSFKEISQNKSKSKDKKPLSYEIEQVLDSIDDFFTICLEYGLLTKEIIYMIKSLSKEYKILLPIEYINFETILENDIHNKTDLYKYVDIDLNVKNINIFKLLSDLDANDNTATEIVKFFISKGYNIKKYINDYYEYSSVLINLKLISIKDMLDNDDYSILDDYNLNKEAYIYLINSNLEYPNNIFLDIIKFLQKNNLISKYKNKILDNISTKNISRDIIEKILDIVDDDDIELACARKLIHKKISNKYDIEMKRRVLENLLTFKNFKKL